MCILSHLLQLHSQLRNLAQHLQQDSETEKLTKSLQLTMRESEELRRQQSLVMSCFLQPLIQDQDQMGWEIYFEETM